MVATRKMDDTVDATGGGVEAGSKMGVSSWAVLLTDAIGRGGGASRRVGNVP